MFFKSTPFGKFVFTIIAAVIAVSPVWAQTGQPNSGKSKPNVLFIMIDDLNDYVSQLRGFPGLKTPNLDKFVKTGVNFTRAYCAAPVCNLSHLILLNHLYLLIMKVILI